MEDEVVGTRPVRSRSAGLQPGTWRMGEEMLFQSASLSLNEANPGRKQSPLTEQAPPATVQS